DIFFGLDDLQRSLDWTVTWQQLYCQHGQPNQLSNFQAEVQQVGSAIRVLRSRAADPRQQLRLDNLQPLVTERLELLQKLIDLKQSGTLDAAVQDKYVTRGMELYTDIHHTITGMRTTEYLLQQGQEDYSRTSAETAALVIFLGYLLAFLLVGVATLLIDREM